MEDQFQRIARLPPYVFSAIGDLKQKARAEGQDIIDFGMGNPDQPTPGHIVDKLIETVRRSDTHRYSQSKGIPRLRRAISDWYMTRYSVEIDPDDQAVVTLGSKEGLAHLALATTGPGDAVLVQNPSYPIHPYGFVISGADIRHVPMINEREFFLELEKAIITSWPKPKMLVISFPSNPTTHCVEPIFFERIVSIALEHKIWVVHDLAYADLCYDGYRAPSILEADGALNIAVEFFSLSKSYNMPGWRVGFCCGNHELVGALTRIKSYLDYGMFTPIQVAAIAALEGDQRCVSDTISTYQLRRDILCSGLNSAGWIVDPPKSTMFVWAAIPAFYRPMGSVEFAKKLLTEAQVAVSPGIGFGKFGEGYIRFGLIENEQRSRQAIRNIKRMFREDGFYGSE